MADFMKGVLVTLMIILYIVSPVDAIPAVPIDDILVTIGTTAYMLTPKE